MSVCLLCAPCALTFPQIATIFAFKSSEKVKVIIFKPNYRRQRASESKVHDEIYDRNEENLYNAIGKSEAYNVRMAEMVVFRPS